MTDEQNRRHSVKPGLSGWAQVSGRNGVTWEEKIELDLEYIEKMSFLFDVKIIFKTVWTAFFKQEGISQEGMDTAEDFGDWLLNTGKIDKLEYEEKQEKAMQLLEV